MMIKQNILLFIILLFTGFNGCKAQNTDNTLITGAMQTEAYLQLLDGKNIALMVNHSSRLDSMHLLDFLISKKIRVVQLFAVEHGIRGEAANGELIDDNTDPLTGIPIISLYGNKKKASADDLENIDLVLFDMQDVGCRFFTYLSSLHYLMEACAENDVPLLLLDRPNPNGDYIDGPVLQPGISSFVGMHPIPVVHGCTLGEMAQMINGEGWLNNGIQCELKVIPVKNYEHSYNYILPVKPSPNLPNQLSVRLYPSLCFFEAANVSIGRGTTFPFQVIAYPGNKDGDFTFTPVAIPGMSKDPLFENELCRGIDLRQNETPPKFTLSYFIRFYKNYPKDQQFWKSKRWIELLSGDPDFYKQITDGLSEEEIKAGWQNDLQEYKQLRKKYLLYPDFE